MSTRQIIPPSLLARTENLDTSKLIPQQFSLGMCDWTDDDRENEDSQPPNKKMLKDLSRKVAAKITLQIFDVEYAKMTKRMVPRTPRRALVGLCETSMSGGWKGTESTGCRSFGYLFYLLSLDLGKCIIKLT